MSFDIRSNFIGQHVIVNYFSCDISNYCQSDYFAKVIAEDWIRILSSINVSTLGSHVHFFDSNAISVSLNLSESHLNFHTWPEHSFVALDFFCCKKSTNLRLEMEGVLEMGREHFKADRLETIWIERGFDVA